MIAARKQSSAENGIARRKRTSSELAADSAAECREEVKNDERAGVWRPGVTVTAGSGDGKEGDACFEHDSVSCTPRPSLPSTSQSERNSRPAVGCKEKSADSAPVGISVQDGNDVAPSCVGDDGRSENSSEVFLSSATAQNAAVIQNSQRKIVATDVGMRADALISTRCCVEITGASDPVTTLRTPTQNNACLPVTTAAAAAAATKART